MISQENQIEINGGGEAVAHVLLQHISEVGLKTGDQLPRGPELAEALHVSRSVIREGMGYLKAMRLVEGKKRGGTVLCQPSLFAPIRLLAMHHLFSDKDIKNLQGLRVMLELGAGELIYRKKTARDLAYLKQIFNSENPIEVGVEEFAKEEIDFHSTLFAISGNPIAMEFRELLNVYFLLRPYKHVDNPPFRMASHQDLCKALEHGSCAEFIAELRSHFEGVFRVLDDDLSIT